MIDNEIIFQILVLALLLNCQDMINRDNITNSILNFSNLHFFEILKEQQGSIVNCVTGDQNCIFTARVLNCQILCVKFMRQI